MCTKVVYHQNLEDTLDEAKELIHLLEHENHQVKRLKIEVPASDYEQFTESSNPNINYFEWHGKIMLSRKEELLELSDIHKVHLSLNALQTEPKVRFITLREYGGYQLFNERLSGLKSALEQQNWQLIKEQSEYCVYDNNDLLDRGWLNIHQENGKA